MELCLKWRKDGLIVFQEEEKRKIYQITEIGRDFGNRIESRTSDSIKIARRI